MAGSGSGQLYRASMDGVRPIEQLSSSWSVEIARVARRLGELADATERLCEGDVRSEIVADGHDEIARIARGVERMRGTMRRALQIINGQSG